MASKTGKCFFSRGRAFDNVLATCVAISLVVEFRDCKEKDDCIIADICRWGTREHQQQSCDTTCHKPLQTFSQVSISGRAANTYRRLCHIWHFKCHVSHPGQVGHNRDICMTTDHVTVIGPRGSGTKHLKFEQDLNQTKPVRAGSTQRVVGGSFAGELWKTKKDRNDWKIVGWLTKRTWIAGDQPAL